MKDYINYISGLGFDTKHEGFKFFISLFQEITERLMNGESELELRELYPCLCLDDYHFYFEVSKFTFYEKLNDFCRNGYKGNDQAEKELFGDEDSFDKLVRLGKKYIQDINKKNQVHKNVFVKKYVNM